MTAKTKSPLFLTETLIESPEACKVADNAKVVEVLNQVLVNLSDLYSQAKVAQWNVRHAHFQLLRGMFAQVAMSVMKPMDLLASRIEDLGGGICGTVRQVASRSGLEEFPVENAGECAGLMAVAKGISQCAASVHAVITDPRARLDVQTERMLREVLSVLEEDLKLCDDFLSELRQ